MNIYYFIEVRLQTIRFFYDTAVAPFLEIIRKIDNGEEPYAPPANWDYESGEPPFFEEWQMNKDGITLLGHATVTMLQVALKLYLDSYKEEVERHHGRQKWAPDQKPVRGDNWFSVYRSVFRNVLGMEWGDFGEDRVGVLEQITLARDDISHQPDLWTIDTSQSKHHFRKYTESFFADDRYLEHFKRTGTVSAGETWRIDVPPERIHSAIDLVEEFCKFIEAK